MSFAELQFLTFARLTISDKLVIIIKAGQLVTVVRHYGKDQQFSINNTGLKPF